MPVWLYTSGAVHLVRPRRPQPARAARAAARAPAPGGRARRPARADAARNLEAPARAARGRARPGPRRGAAPRLRRRPVPAGGGRRLARALPAPLERQPRRARAAPRPDRHRGGVAVYGTYETIDGRPAVRFERALSPRRRAGLARGHRAGRARALVPELGRARAA